MINCERLAYQAVEAGGRTFKEIESDPDQVWLDITFAEAQSIAVLDMFEFQSRRVRELALSETLQILTYDPNVLLRVFVCEGLCLTGEGT